MNRTLVVVFSEPSKPFEGRDVLKGLDRDDVLTLYSYAIITKQPDGTCVVNDEHDVGGLRTVLGTTLGSLIGLLGGPTGVAIGAVAGTFAGITANLDNARVSADFVDEVSKQLAPGKFALLAEIDEEWTAWIDLPMEELGGVVYRYTLSDVKHAANSTDVAAMKADLAQLKAEHGQARTDHKAKLHDKISQLETKIQQQLEKSKQRRELAEAQAQAKANVLKAKAARKEADSKDGTPSSQDQHKIA
jgi:uncharacterized membrane protein